MCYGREGTERILKAPCFSQSEVLADVRMFTVANRERDRARQVFRGGRVFEGYFADPAAG